MSLRELLILLLGLAILVVILRGLYIAIQARRGQIRLAIDKNIPSDVDLDALELAELPGGGARLVSRDGAGEQAAGEDSIDNKSKAEDSERLRQAEQRSARVELAGDDDHGVPVLMEAVELSEQADITEPEYKQPAGGLPGQNVERTAGTPEAESQGTIAAADEDVPSPDEWADNDAEPLGEVESYSEPHAALLAESERDDASSEAAEDDVDYHEEEPNASARDSDSTDEFPADVDDVLFDYRADGADGAGGEEAAQGEGLSQLRPDYLEDPEAQEDELSAEGNDEQPDELLSPEAADTGDAGDEERTFNEVDLENFTMSAGERIAYSEPAAKSGGSRWKGFGRAGQDARREQQDSAKEAATQQAGQEASDDVQRQPSLFDEPAEQQVDTGAAMEKSRDDLKSAFSRGMRAAFGRRKAESAKEPANDENEPETPAAVQPLEEVKEPDAVLTVPDELEPDSTALESPEEPVASEQASTVNETSEVLVVSVMAREGFHFAGDDLLQVLISSGLKFGEMNIFHQRAYGDKQGPVIFSVANALNPGTFDLNTMSNFSTIGISFFLSLPCAINNMEAFEKLLEVARQISSALDGELRDDQRNLMTGQTIEHYRQRVRDFELRQLKQQRNRA